MTNPVIETNIELILSDHLPSEVDGINARIKDLMDQVGALSERKAKLLRIAEAAGISLPSHTSPSHDTIDYLR